MGARAAIGIGVAGLLALASSRARAELPVSLDQVAVPEPANLAAYVKDRAAAIRLGKALFWDVQVGSDGATACATCHFHAGADSRTRNTVAPGPDGAFSAGGANADLRREDFPFVKRQDPDDGASPLVRDRVDVVGAQGVTRAAFEGSVPGGALERGREARDATFAHGGRNLRQVTGRNAPSVLNAVFNVTSFWDGRAHPFFNGANPFGLLDPSARVWVDGAAGLEAVSLTAGVDADPATPPNPWALDAAALASQAVGPPLSDVEMSFAGRSWPDVGRKLLPLRPLAGQRVHPADSVLGALAVRDGAGLATTYADLVRAAFREPLWRSAEARGGYAQAEANFALFFGLAIQLYEATLVSDQTPFDRFLRGDPRALTERQVRGLNLFFSGGTNCGFCHTGPELTAASWSQTRAPGEPGMIEQMITASGALANYDIGFYNIGVRPTAEDLGRGARVFLDGRDLPLSFTVQWLERATMPFTPLAQPGCVNDVFGEPPNVCPPNGAPPLLATAVRGAFKTPGLRNVELTGPYMHDGGMATLRQVVQFYVRGSNFENLGDRDPLFGVPGLVGDEEKQEDLVDFLLALTDERVRWEQAPFDHPQLRVPDGHEPRPAGHPKRARSLADRIREIPAVGAAGRRAQGLPPLKPFLAAELAGEALSSFHFQP